MQILRSLWLFIQGQVLGMKWLNVDSSPPLFLDLHYYK